MRDQGLVTQIRGVKLKLIVEGQVSAALRLTHVRCRCKFRCIDEQMKKYNHVCVF